MTPFDWFSFLLRFWAGAPGAFSPATESSGAAGAGVGLGACANADPATNMIPATNRQSREVDGDHRSLN
jgi:hypothetical protein